MLKRNSDNFFHEFWTWMCDRINICSPHSQCAIITVRNTLEPEVPRKLSTGHGSLYLILNFHLHSSARMRVNWFLAFPSCSWAVYVPLSSSQKFWIISSTRPFPLMKFILCVCVKQSKYEKLNHFFPQRNSFKTRSWHSVFCNTQTLQSCSVWILIYCPCLTGLTNEARALWYSIFWGSSVICLCK